MESGSLLALCTSVRSGLARSRADRPGEMARAVREMGAGARQSAAARARAPSIGKMSFLAVSSNTGIIGSGTTSVRSTRHSSLLMMALPPGSAKFTNLQISDDQVTGKTLISWLA